MTVTNVPTMKKEERSWQIGLNHFLTLKSIDISIVANLLKYCQTHTPPICRFKFTDAFESEKLPGRLLILVISFSMPM